MVHCQYELNWDIIKQEQKGYSISENLKRDRRKRTILRIVILIVWIQIIILLNTYKSIIGAVLLILCLLYYKFFSKYILKRKFIKRRDCQNGKWVVNLWIDNKIVLQNIKGRSEITFIPFSEIREYGIVQDYCYFVANQYMILVPIDSFQKESQDEFLKKMQQISFERKELHPKSSYATDVRDVMLVTGITLLILTEFVLAFMIFLRLIDLLIRLSI